MMRRICLFILTMAMVMPAMAKARDEVEFFARVLCDKAQLVEGDSCLVSYVIYSSMPPAEVECKNALKLKGASVRPIRFNREATMRRVSEGGRVLYRMVWAQYVVCPRKKGKYKLSPFRFKALFTYYRHTGPAGFSYFSRRPEIVKTKAKAVSAKQSLVVTAPPRRTTIEIMESGENVF